jgi:hypothetical protein
VSFVEFVGGRGIREKGEPRLIGERMEIFGDRRSSMEANRSTEWRAGVMRGYREYFDVVAIDERRRFGEAVTDAQCRPGFRLSLASGVEINSGGVDFDDPAIAKDVAGDLGGEMNEITALDI